MDKSANFSGLRITRRDLMKAGAAGLAGLSLPLVSTSKALAGKPTANGITPGVFVNPQFINPHPNLGPLAEAGIVLDPDSIPTVPATKGGCYCISGRNDSDEAKVLVWYVFNAPNAKNWPFGDFLTGQVLSNLRYIVVGPHEEFTDFCVGVPSNCHQADLYAYPADLCKQIPGLIGYVDNLRDENHGFRNLLSIVVTNADCNDDCIRMTGGGQTDGLYTLGGIPVSVSQGFQLRTGPGAHSNLEVNFPNPNGGVSQFHLGPPDGYSDFHGGTMSCADGGDGQQPQATPNAIYGLARGTLDGIPAMIYISFVDCGEPGVNDTRLITIWDSLDTTQTPVLFAGSLNDGRIVHGNNQAHKC